MGHAINSSLIINQADDNITYPGTSTSVFYDDNFYADCGKTGAYGNIKDNGCAICALATFVLHKGDLSASNNNVYNAVKQVTIEATNNAADVTYNSFSVKVGSKTVRVNMRSTSDIAAAVNDGDICFIRIEEGGKSHYVLVDGMDYSASGFDRYLIADPDGGEPRTLQDSLERIHITANAKKKKKKYILS